MIGTGVGIGLLLYAGLSGEYHLALGAPIAPFAATLADADHNSTKVGRTRKQAVSIVKKVCIIVISVLCALACLSLYLGETKYILLGAPYLAVGTLIAMLARVPAVKVRLKFFTKHRGIMHTLLLPALAGVGYALFNNAGVRGVLIGFILGYTSHLFADMWNPEKCPLLWPLTKKPIGIGIARADSKFAVVLSYLFTGGFICLGIYLGYLKI